MIKVYSGIEGIKAPSLNMMCNLDFKVYEQKCEEYKQRVIEWCKQNSVNQYTGKIVSFGVADGYAQYVVLKPSKIIHLNIYDGYHFQYVDRLLAKDIIQKAKQADSIRKIFS